MFYHTRITQESEVAQKRDFHDEIADDAVWDISRVSRIIGVSVSTVKRLVRRDEFPAPLKLSANRIGWRRGTVEGWLRERTGLVVQSQGPKFRYLLNGIEVPRDQLPDMILGLVAERGRAKMSG